MVRNFALPENSLTRLHPDEVKPVPQVIDVPEKPVSSFVPAQSKREIFSEYLNAFEQPVANPAPPISSPLLADAFAATEERLRESEERYRLISAIVSDYVFSSRVEDDGTLQLDWVAGAFEAITGYTLEEYRARGGWAAAGVRQSIVPGRDGSLVRAVGSLFEAARCVRSGQP